jgi:hypothetical protein
MTRRVRAMRPWTVCLSCGSALQPDRRWVDDDGLLCGECARRRRAEFVRRREASCERAPEGTRRVISAEVGAAA